MPERHVVVVDVESSGLDPKTHEAVEVAWWNINTGERGVFVPRHFVSKVLASAEIKALQINRYIDRLALADQDIHGVEVKRLADQLDGHTLAGSNPTFDAAMLTKMFAGYAADHANTFVRAPRWHHRLLDVSAFGAGVLGLPLDQLPGLAKLCELLGVDPGDHTAEQDVRATGVCLLKLQEIAAARAAA